MRFSNFSRPPCIFLIVPSRQEPVQTFELNLRPFLPKTVSRCQGNSGNKITQNDGMLIKTHGTTRWAGKKTGNEMSTYGPMYLHFDETCLKRHTKKYCRPDEKLDYSIITLADETRNNLSDEEKDFLTGIGINFSYYMFTETWLIARNFNVINELCNLLVFVRTFFMNFS